MMSRCREAKAQKGFRKLKAWVHNKMSAAAHAMRHRSLLRCGAGLVVKRLKTGEASIQVVSKRSSEGVPIDSRQLTMEATVQIAYEPIR